MKRNLAERVDAWLKSGGREELTRASEGAALAQQTLVHDLTPDQESLAKPMTL